MDNHLKERLEAFEQNAKNRVLEQYDITRYPKHDKDYYKRNTRVPEEPVIIASTEGVGTMRVRANHIDSVIHYTQEQVALKKANAPL